MPRKAVSKAAAEPAEESLGQRLARLRKEKGYTQVELAEKIGTIQTVISDYERDRLRPHPEMLVAFATTLEVSADEILGLGSAKASTGSGLNRRLLRRLKEIDKLSKRDQDALIRTIDAFLGKAS